MHKTSRGTPKGAYIMFKSLKTNTNRMMNEEHGARNGIGIDHDRDLAAPQPCFPLLSSFFLLFLLIPSLLDLLTLSQPPFTPIYRKNKHLRPWQLAQAI